MRREQHMGELEISDQAVDAGLMHYGDIGTVRDIIAAAAPLIVAAELRRLAASFDSAAAQVPLARLGDQLNMGRIIIYQECRDIVTRRADEVDTLGDALS